MASEEEYIPPMFIGLEEPDARGYRHVTFGFVREKDKAFLRIPYFVYHKAEAEFTHAVRETIQATLKTFNVTGESNG